jgi:hypothetical protein
VIAVCVLAACSGSSKSAPTSTRPARATGANVEVFGDSLVVQAADALRVQGRAHGLDVTVAAYFGLAPCDLLSTVRADLTRPPRAVVIAFSGNNITPCMARDGRKLIGAAYYAAYRRDVGELVASVTALHVPVLIVGPPRLAAEKNVPDRVELDSVFRQIAAQYPGARFVSTAPTLSPHGFTPTLPCVAAETAALGCRAGRITVRSADGIHFDEPHSVSCPPGAGGHDACRYSAGAHRYADVVLAALADVAGWSYLAAASAVGVPIDVTRDG